MPKLDAIFTLARHVQLKIMPIPLFKTKCYQILVSKPFLQSLWATVITNISKLKKQSSFNSRHRALPLNPTEQILVQKFTSRTSSAWISHSKTCRETSLVWGEDTQQQHKKKKLCTPNTIAKAETALTYTKEDEHFNNCHNWHCWCSGKSTSTTHNQKMPVG